MNREHPCRRSLPTRARNFAAKPGIVERHGQQEVPRRTTCHLCAALAAALRLKRFLMNSIASPFPCTLAVALEHYSGLTPDQKSTLQELRSTAVDASRLAEAAAEAEPDLSGGKLCSSRSPT